MILGTAPGTASRVFSIPGQSIPAVIRVPGLTATTVAITSVGFGQDANVQFMHALRRKIYIYSFGERMGNVQISGVAFYRLCNAVTSSTGIQRVMDYYKSNSVSQRSTPVTITIGGESIQGFVRGIRSTFSDPERGVIGFSIIMATLPELWGASRSQGFTRLEGRGPGGAGRLEGRGPGGQLAGPEPA